MIVVHALPELLPSGCAERALAQGKWLKATWAVLGVLWVLHAHQDRKSKTALICRQELLVCGFYSGIKIGGAVSIARVLQADFLPLAGIGQSACSSPVHRWNSHQGFFNVEWIVLLGWSSGKRPRAQDFNKEASTCLYDFCIHYTNLLNKMFF